MNAGDIRRALVRYVDWWQNIVVPEFSIENGGDRADLIQITRSGYVTEYEIKISAGDWRKDLLKPKWTVCPTTGNQYVSRFFYVVPGKTSKDRAEGGLAPVDITLKRGTEEWLVPAIKVPPSIPPSAGIIAVFEGGWCKELRAARRHKVAPLPDEILRRAMDCFYYRFWRLTRDFEQAAEDFREALKRDRVEAAE